LKQFNEENTKKDFILPLFRHLGWDVTNSDEVAAEEKSSNGRVDYAFKIGGVSKFYLEAKPLREDLNQSLIGKAHSAVKSSFNLLRKPLGDEERLKCQLSGIL